LRSWKNSTNVFPCSGADPNLADALGDAGEHDVHDYADLRTMPTATEDLLRQAWFGVLWAA